MAKLVFRPAHFLLSAAFLMLACSDPPEPTAVVPGILTSGSGDVKAHQTAGVVDLVPGADRGTITQPLLRGTIDGTGQEVLFVITDASDKDFAEMFGVIRADALADAPDAAVETAFFQGGNWTFFEDPGLVASATEGPVANPNYSPLKRITWNGKLVTVNAPFVKWGDGPRQQLLVDEGGIDPRIRSNPPSPFFVGNGPRDGASEAQYLPRARWTGTRVDRWSPST